MPHATMPAGSPRPRFRQRWTRAPRANGGTADGGPTAGKVMRLMFLSVFLLACADDALGPRPAAFEPESGTALGQGSVAADLSGTWAVSGELQMIVPDWVAEFILGIDPEGPMTHIRCTFSSTAELVQDGNTFTGVETQDPNQCVTRGGQVFQSGGGQVPVVDGHVRGRSVSFALDDFPVFCPHQGVIADVQDGVAYRMRGTGRCILPGHPASPLGLPPPPGGVTKVLSWEYARL